MKTNDQVNANQRKTGGSRASAASRDTRVDQQIAALIARLFLHYRMGDMAQNARDAVAMDWLDDLREFGPKIVEEACAEYRQTQTFRPTPADIRRLCIEAQSSQREHDHYRRALSAPGVARGTWSPEEEEAYARQAGWSSALERRDAIAAQEEKYRLAEEWRRSTGFMPGNPGNSPAKRMQVPEHTPEQWAKFQQQLGIGAAKGDG